MYVPQSGFCSAGVEPIPAEVSSNHLFESSMDVSDDKKPQQQQQQQQTTTTTTTSESRPATTDAAAAASTTARAVTPSSATLGRDGISSRAEYMTSPTATPVANGLIR